MNVLGLCSYPVDAAATRFRMAQFVEPLRSHGIELTISPFLDSKHFNELYEGQGILKGFVAMLPFVLRRFGDLFSVRKYDLIYVQREVMIFGPGIFEWLFQKIGNVPLILDLDDATYISYESPSYGRLGKAFKFFGKTDKLIMSAEAVVCGNRFIAEYVESKGTRAIVIPTVVDTEKFRPRKRRNDIPIIGWIGTHSTFPFLESVFPVLERLAAKHRFVLRVVGSGRVDIAIAGIEVDNRKWSVDKEVNDFQTLDIGLYPIVVSDSASEQWISGKSGFKAIQYMAVGVPFVMSPVGVCAEIGEPGLTHFDAVTDEDWYNSLNRLLSSSSLRRHMSNSCRDYSLANYHLADQVEKLAAVFERFARKAE